jgi:hypothetical protein
MNFKTFFYLKESPDEVYTNDGEWLNPGHSDTRTFGWFAYIKEVEPFLICSKRGRSTHWDLYHDFFNHLSQESNLATPPTKYYIPKYHDVVKQLKKTKHWEAISRGEFVSKLDKDSDEEEGLGGYNIKAEVESVYRTKVFQNSGRIWLNNGVISFWNKQGEVPAKRILEILSLFKKTPDSFYIDVVDINNIKDEESDRKELPTVKEYMSRSFTGKGSKESEKKYQELLAKKHIATDPTERKRLQDLALNGAEKEWGSSKVAKDTPLSLRQKAFTSESKK